jgi:hypothetical protein
MTVQAVVIGTGDGPIEVQAMRYAPGEVRIGVAHLTLYLRAGDIDRLSAALLQAREVLTVSTSASKARSNQQ